MADEQTIQDVAKQVLAHCGFDQTRAAIVLGRAQTAILSGIIKNDVDKAMIGQVDNSPSAPQKELRNKKGAECICLDCKSKPYIITANIYEGEEYEKVIRKIKPNVTGVPIIEDGTVFYKDTVKNDYYIDCPLCGSKYTVFVFGKRWQGINTNTPAPQIETSDAPAIAQGKGSGFMNASSLGL